MEKTSGEILFNGKKIDEEIEKIITPGEEIHKIITPGVVGSNKKEVEKEIMRSSNSKTSEFDLQKGLSKSYMPSKK